MNKRQRKKARREHQSSVMTIDGVEYRVMKTRVKGARLLRGRMKRWFKRHPFVEDVPTEEPILVGLGAWLEQVPKT